MPGPISLAHATDEPMSATEEPIFDPAKLDDDDGMVTNDAGRCMHDYVVDYEAKMHNAPSWFNKAFDPAGLFNKRQTREKWFNIC